MSPNQIQSNNLKAGEFYGQVPQKRLLDSMILTEVKHANPIRVPRHSHELGFFQLLLNGNYRETGGGKTFTLYPMTLSWHRPWLMHQDEIGNDGARFFVIEIKLPYLKKLEELIKPPDDFYVKNEPLSWLACRLFHEFRNWELGSNLVSEGIALEMLGWLAKNQNFEEKRQPLWLKRIIEKLNEEFRTNLTSEELAAEANVHPVYLASIFRQFYHETMGEYVQKLRLKHATELLNNKALSLADVAYSSGFSDQSHMNRIFKRFIGQTPGSLRSLLISNPY